MVYWLKNWKFVHEISGRRRFGNRNACGLGRYHTPLSRSRRMPHRHRSLPPTVVVPIIIIIIISTCPLTVRPTPSPIAAEQVHAYIRHLLKVSCDLFLLLLRSLARSNSFSRFLGRPISHVTNIQQSAPSLPIVYVPTHAPVHCTRIASRVY